MKCQVCGERIAFNFFEDINEELKRKGLCHTDNFWMEKLKLDRTIWKDSHVIVNGVHYHIAPPDPTNPWRGHGGAKFKIRFNDGREVTTTNLWCQGDIPEWWREVLPDNAVFVADLGIHNN